MNFVDLPDEMIDEILARTDVPSIVRALGTSTSFRQRHLQPEYLARIHEAKIEKLKERIANKAIEMISTSPVIGNMIMNPGNYLLKEYIPSLPLEPSPVRGHAPYPLYNFNLLVSWINLYAFLNNLYIANGDKGLIKIDNVLSKLSRYREGSLVDNIFIASLIGTSQTNHLIHRIYYSDNYIELWNELRYITKTFELILEGLREAKRTNNKEEYDLYLEAFSSPIKYTPI